MNRIEYIGGFVSLIEEGCVESTVGFNKHATQMTALEGRSLKHSLILDINIDTLIFKKLHQTNFFYFFIL